MRTPRTTQDGWTSMDGDDKRAHLGFLQNVITRMAGNSFLIRGWSVTLVSAILALTSGSPSTWSLAVPLLPALTFWGLDGYFLAQERLFRKLYDAVAKDPQAHLWSMKTDPLTRAGWLQATFSVTLVPFHGTVLLVALTFLLRSFA